MKRLFSILTVLCLLLSLAAGCASGQSGFQQDGDRLTLTREGIAVTVNAVTGMLESLSSGYDSLEMEGILVEAGLNGQSLFGQLGCTDLSALATYELPVLWPKRKELPTYTVDAITATKEGFTVSITCDCYTFLYRYSILKNGLSLAVTLSTTAEEAVPVNGVGFLVRGIQGFSLEGSTFEYPGSTPAGQLHFSGQSKYKAAVSDYSAPVIQLADGESVRNILFVNEVEKWTSGCYYDENDRPCAAFLSATEGYLTQDAPMEVGTLYLPLLQPETDPYAAVSEFWTQLGYHTPTDTSATKELYAIYSGHPYGTMDTGYFNRLTLSQYAGQLDGIAGMGFDAVWLLPVFQHTGDNVYEPIDEGLIDQRYGGLEEARTYIAAAHQAGMKVLFDFVPHGPRPVYPFAKEHDDWISKDRSGANQIEWECVSMDYNHPEYAQYMLELAQYYAQEIGLDGARIDCSMGGLPNWSSAAGLRASAAGLCAGVNVVRSIRNGFLAAGTQVLLLPENFHPSPAYAPYTDVFYDMPLYRCLFNLNQRGLSDAEFVSELTRFLDAERKTSVDGQLKLRFLGNHDTVTWTFDAQRAQTLYGTERAKALWMAMGWIDGVLYIYQGDEDPDTYHLSGENLTPFFTELIAAKRSYLPAQYATAYVETGTPVMAFYRYEQGGTDAKLVLINLSDTPQTYSLGEGDTPLAAIGTYRLDGQTVSLEAYSGIILDSSYSQ